MKPIYITDLDHTFLRSDQTISAFSQKVWNTKSQESILSVATARSYTKSLEFLTGLRLEAPLILLDGALVVSCDKKLIDLKLVDENLGNALIDEGSRFDIEPFVIGLKDLDLNEAFLYPGRLNTHQSKVLLNYKNDNRLAMRATMRTMKQTLKIVYFGDEHTLRPLAAHFKNIFGDQVELKLSPEKYNSGYFLTILHPHGDKAHALETIADHLGRELRDFTVFGDSINDLGMFDKAGTAVAVKNALDEVKAKADIVLPHTNDEDAVAKYLAIL